MGLNQSITPRTPRSPHQEEIKVEQLFPEDPDEEIDYEALELKPFDMNDFKDLNSLYTEGKKHINISAAGSVYQVISKIAGHIRTNLTDLIDKKGREHSQIKRFVVGCCRVGIAEYLIYSAFQAKHEAIYYQNEESPDWKILNEITINVEIKD